MHSTSKHSSSPNSDGSSSSDSTKADHHHPHILQRDHILRDILAHVDAYARPLSSPSFDTAPLKDDVLRPVLRGAFDPEVQLRGFLRALRHTPAFTEALADISNETLRERVRAFADGKSAREVLGGETFVMPTARHARVVRRSGTKGQEGQEELEGNEGKQLVVGASQGIVVKILDAARELFGCCLSARVKEGETDTHELPKVYEDEARAKIMEVRILSYLGLLHFLRTPIAGCSHCFTFATCFSLSNHSLFVSDEAHNSLQVYLLEPFSNWGGTVHNKPRYTFLPTTVLGVQNLVRYAAANGLRVRCAGYRHSWSSIFSSDDAILVSFVDIEQVTTLPDPMSLAHRDGTGGGELKTIELQEQLGDTKRLCRIGAGVTNEDFRRWAVANNAWALPVDVILVEVTIGGVNGPICHGAGRRHMTCSDGVRRVEYVDCNGELQVVDDPELLKAAAGSFGLLGVVTHITFELDRMTYAVMEPRKVDVGLAIPPLRKEDIPAALRADWYDEDDAEERMKVAREEFERRAADDYYSEWFWFTYQQKAWVNTWNVVEEATNAVNYPDDAAVFLQWIEGWIGGVLTSRYIIESASQAMRNVSVTDWFTSASSSTRSQGPGRRSCWRRWVWLRCLPNSSRMTLQVSSQYTLPSASFTYQHMRSAQNATHQRAPLPPRHPEHARPRHGVPDPAPAAPRRPHTARLQRRPARLVGRD